MIDRVRTRLHQIGDSGPGAQGGSAIVEFVFLAVLMIVPLFYLVMVLARLQAGAFGVSAAAREAGRAYVTAQAQGEARTRAESAAGLAFADQGFSDQEGSITIRCRLEPCLRPEGRITVTATVWVPMPLVPAFFSGVVSTQVPVTATHVETVDRFGGQ
ncbi:MAG: pilus assembly protein [Actinomycetota bacterium]